MFSLFKKKNFSPYKKKIKDFQKQNRLDKRLVNSLNRTKFPSRRQLKYFPKILTPGEKRQFKLALGIIAVTLAILVVRGYFSLTIPVPRQGGEYSEGLIGSPMFINPILTQTDVDRDLVALTFSGLLKYDKHRQLVPDLAESYQISSDQLNYTFKLKENIFWHDGEKFTADDVIFTIASIQDSEFKSPLFRNFRGIAAEKIDEYTVQFTLKEPFAPFVGLLTVGILPEHLWYSIPPSNADLTELNKKPIGTGPWKFENFKKDQVGIIKSYTLVPNPDYYGKNPYLKKIVFKFYGDEISAVEALKNKDIDGIAFLSKDYQSELKKYKNLNYHQLNQPQYTAIFFNQRESELLEADYIREALVTAIDKEKIVKEVFGLGKNAKIIDGPALPGVEINPEVKKYPHQPEKAANLLKKNGWELSATSTPDGLTEQIRKKKNWYLTLDLTTVNRPENVKTAELLKNFWEQIGFKITLKIIEPRNIIQEVINPRDYQTLLFAENLGTDPDSFSFWHSSQSEYPGLNLTGFSDKESDRLLEEARQTNDWETRKEKYFQFQKIVSEKLPAIFLYNTTYTYPQYQKLKGFDLVSIAEPADRFANLNEWYLKTRRVWK